MPSSVITSLSTSSRGTNTSGNSHSTARSPSPTIARYASASAAKPPTNGVKATPPLPLDLGPTRDFCNCFWGLDDAGANVLFSRMRTATQTITELEDFWRDRARIEEEYAAKLKALGSRVLGKEETGQFKLSLDTLATETSTQATAHAQFAALVKSELLASISAYAEKQAADAAQVQAPLEARYKTKHTAESAIMKAREKYESNCLRLASYTQQMAVNPGKDVERLQMKIARSQQTVTSNEKELETAVKAIREATVRWQKDWKEWCDLCQDMEEERLDYVKDVIWGYANAVSTLCVSDDQSCERIRVSLDQVDAFQDVESFVEECGTGIAIPAPPSWATFSPSNTNGLSPPPVQSASFTRVSARPAVPPSEQPPIKTTRNSRETSRESSSSPPVVPVKPAMAINTENGINHSIPKNIPPPPPIPQTPPSSAYSTKHDRRKSSQASLRRVSTPLPPQPGSGGRSATPAPIPPMPTRPPDTDDERADGERILFFVQALYDYRATIDEEFDFEEGDIIAVKATPDDGWWSGELLDEKRRVEGRHIFPSNFITLF